MFNSVCLFPSLFISCDFILFLKQDIKHNVSCFVTFLHRTTAFVSLQAESTTSGRQSGRVETEKMGVERRRIGWGHCDRWGTKKGGTLVCSYRYTCGHM